LRLTPQFTPEGIGATKKPGAVIAGDRLYDQKCRVVSFTKGMAVMVAPRDDPAAEPKPAKHDGVERLPVAAIPPLPESDLRQKEMPDPRARQSILRQTTTT